MRVVKKKLYNCTYLFYADYPVFTRYNLAIIETSSGIVYSIYEVSYKIYTGKNGLVCRSPSPPPPILSAVLISFFYFYILYLYCYF